MRRLALVLAVLMAAGIALPVSAETTGVRWKQRPLSIVLVPETQDARILAAMQYAAEVWSLSPVVDVTIGPKPKRGPYAPIRTYYNPDSYIVGRTSVSNERGYITGTTVYLNTWYTDTASDAGVRTLLCHEVGHTLGLAHNDDRASCMYALISVELPSAEDYADLLTLYGR